MQINEYDFPVPWGVIAVKAWGDPNDPTVLVIHGITDNAGSFDRLIPLLPKGFYYACVELPGHGKSSHFPHGTPLFTLNYLMAYIYITNHFNRENYIIIGHSYGAQIAQLFAQLFPDKVSKLVMLDTTHLWMYEANGFQDLVLAKFSHFMKLQSKLNLENPPLYTYEEAKKRIINGRTNVLKAASAEALLKRHLVPVGDKFKFTQDPRLRHFINPLHDEDYALKLLKHYPLRCHVLIIVAQGVKMERMLAARLYNFLKNQPNVNIVQLEEYSHDVHNNDPELVAPHVSQFLLEQKNKL